VYVLDLRKSGYTVSTEMLLLEASKIAQKFNIPVTTVNSRLVTGGFDAF
jgi:hypothetical protein